MQYRPSAYTLYVAGSLRQKYLNTKYLFLAVGLCSVPFQLTNLYNFRFLSHILSTLYAAGRGSTYMNLHWDEGEANCNG